MSNPFVFKPETPPGFAQIICLGSRRTPSGNWTVDHAWHGPKYLPAYLDLYAIDCLGGLDKFPWPLKKIGDDPHRAIIIVARTDAGLLGMVHAARHQARRGWERFSIKCRRTYHIWTH